MWKQHSTSSMEVVLLSFVGDVYFHGSAPIFHLFESSCRSKTYSHEAFCASMDVFLLPWILVPCKSMKKWKLFRFHGTGLLPWFLGSGQLVGLWRLLRRVPNGKAHLRGRGGRAVSKLVEHPLEADYFEAYECTTTPMEASPTFMGAFFSPTDIDDSFHGSSWKLSWKLVEGSKESFTYSHRSGNPLTLK